MFRFDQMGLSYIFLFRVEKYFSDDYVVKCIFRNVNITEAELAEK